MSYWFNHDLFEENNNSLDKQMFCKIDKVINDQPHLQNIGPKMIIHILSKYFDKQTTPLILAFVPNFKDYIIGHTEFEQACLEIYGEINGSFIINAVTNTNDMHIGKWFTSKYHDMIVQEFRNMRSCQQLACIKKCGWLIKCAEQFVNDPTSEMILCAFMSAGFDAIEKYSPFEPHTQLELVKCDNEVFFKLKQPSSHVVRYCYETFEFIKRYYLCQHPNIPHDVQLLIVKDGYFRALINPCQKAIELAIIMDPSNIKSVEQNMMTPKLWTIAFSQDPNIANLVPINIRTDEMWHHLVTKDCQEIANVPEHLLTHDMANIAFKQNDKLLQFIPKHLYNTDMWEHHVRHKPEDIKEVPRDKLNKWIYLAAIEKDWKILDILNDLEKTKSMCYAAIKQDHRAIKYVPSYYLFNKTFVMEAVQINPLILHDIELWKEALKINGQIISKVPKQFSEEINEFYDLYKLVRANYPIICEYLGFVPVKLSDGSYNWLFKHDIANIFPNVVGIWLDNITYS